MSRARYWLWWWLYGICLVTLMHLALGRPPSLAVEFLTVISVAVVTGLAIGVGRSLWRNR